MRDRGGRASRLNLLVFSLPRIHLENDVERGLEEEPRGDLNRVERVIVW